MPSPLLSYALLAALAIALVIAAATDIRRREIDNWLTGGIALAAPLYWLAAGDGHGAMLLQLGLAAAAFALLFALFALGAVGGGDVKLLAALALWLPLFPYLRLLVLMSLLGGGVTLACAVHHHMRRRLGPVAVPYGVAISSAGLWVLASIHLPILQQAVGAR